MPRSLNLIARHVEVDGQAYVPRTNKSLSRLHDNQHAKKSWARCEWLGEECVSARRYFDVVGKYDRLRPLFEGAAQDPLTFSFTELEEAMGGPLPNSARTHPAWWAPSQRNAVWVDYGFRVVVDFNAETATFQRASIQVEASPGVYTDAESKAREWNIDWERYDLWNGAIYEHFFTGRWQGRPVYLDLDDHALEQLGGLLSDGESPDVETLEAEFAAAVVATLLVSEEGAGTFTAHAERLRKWRGSKAENIPPFLALLGFFSRVADQMRSGGGLRSTNYLGRLADAVGIGRSDEDARAKLQRDFRRQSHAFWGALNSWLDESGGARGLPTARVFDWRVHIGLPISQALVKEADREKFKGLFARFGFSGGESLSTNDMRRLLDGWIKGSAVSPYVKGLWDSGIEGKNRIAEIASVELAGWDGTTPEAEAGERRVEQIRLAATIRTFPVKRIDLAFVVKSAEYGRERFTPVAGSPEIEAIVGGEGTDYHLSDDLGADWMSIRSNHELSIPDALLIALRLENGERKLRRFPRGVVVMHEDEESGLLVEVERIHLGTDAHLLVNRALREEVEAVIKEEAREGFRTSDPGQCLGLPEDWVLIENVQLLGIPETSNENLGPLIPIAWSQVSFGAGLSLPGTGFWHTKHPPEVRASALDNERGYVELVRQDFNDDQPRREELGTVEGSAVFQLTELGLTDGDFVVAVKDKPVAKSRAIVSGSFKLRSAEHPRFAGLDHLAHDFANDPAGAAVTARIVDAEEDPDVGLRGAVAVDLPTVPSNGAGSVPANLDPTLRPMPSEDESGPTQATAAHVSAGPTCAIGGGHYWILPPAHGGGGWNRWMEGYCKRCNMSKWFPTRPRRKQAHRKKGAGKAEVAEFSASQVEPIQDAEAIDSGTLFDGICFAQAGTWASLVKLSAQFDDSPWFAAELAKTLSSLGHIDLSLDRHGLHPKRFAVAPATLASTPSGTVVMCGHRNRAIRDAVIAAAEQLGLAVEIVSDRAAPDTVSIQIDEAGAEIALAELAGADLEEPIVASVLPALSVARALPRLSSLLLWLPDFKPPGSRAEVYDPHSNSWQRTTTPTQPGAYRFMTRPISYGLMQSPGQMVRADNRWVKWLAANSSRTVMFAYEPDRNLLKVPIGARLPGLFERAIVLSSGLPPRDGDKVTEYRGVSDEVAEIVSSKLMT